MGSDLHTWADTVPYKNDTSPLNSWLDIFLLLSSYQTVFPGKLIVGLWYDKRHFLTTTIFVITWDDELIPIVLEALFHETLQYSLDILEAKWTHKTIHECPEGEGAVWVVLQMLDDIGFLG